jgi:hypothetical protein
MTKTTYGRLLLLNREPVFNGFVKIATSDKGIGVFKPEQPVDLQIPLHEPLILEEPEMDRVVVVERVEGTRPPVAFFCLQ